jgi:hypothetical protein
VRWDVAKKKSNAKQPKRIGDPGATEGRRGTQTSEAHEPAKLDEPDAGLRKFYTSQARLMLDQYDNITDLLGKTKDYSAPGTHCEVLLRNFLRGYLPPLLKADKGFIHRRRSSGGGTKRCPEIDILIHDDNRFRPLFRLEDVVIVRAKAARGAIQVKRCMTPTQLARGLKNVMEAREHLEFVKSQEGFTGTFFFSAVLFFEEGGRPRQDGRPKDTYRNCLTKVFNDPAKCELAPGIVGSLKKGGHILYRQNTPGGLEYLAYPAEYDEQHIALQLLLRLLSGTLPNYLDMFPLSLPRVPDAVLTPLVIFPPPQG